MEYNDDEKIKVQVLRVGINNNKKIIVEANHEMFNEMEDIEALYLLIGVLEGQKIRLHDRICEIEMDNTIEDDDEESGNNKYGLF